jgi:hypothetical protein
LTRVGHPCILNGVQESLARSPFETYGAVIPRQQFAPPGGYSMAPYAPAPRAPTVWETYRTMFSQPQPAQSPVQSAVQGLRHSGEGAAIAALLALAYRHFGTLDVADKYPVDAILSALLFALSVKNAGEPEGYAGDLRALSQSCSDVFVFRKLSGIDNQKTEAPKLASTKSNARDPLLEAAHAAGF